MNRSIAVLVVLLSCAWGVPAAAAPIIAIQPTTQAIGVGGAVSADVMATNLSDEFIGTYDLTIDWDPLLLSLTGVTFGVGLDGPVDSIQAATSGAFSANVFEVSLGLLAAQDGRTPFRLFSLEFISLAPGTSSLQFSSATQLVGDAAGLGYTGVGLSGARVTATQATSVPEPGTLALLSLGLAGVGFVRRWRSR